MVINIKAQSRMFNESSSVYSKMMQTELIMSDVVSSVISKFENSVDKKRKIPSIWDIDTESADASKPFRKTAYNSDPLTLADMDSEVKNNYVNTAATISHWNTPGSDSKSQNQKMSDQKLSRNEPLDELFPEFESYNHYKSCQNMYSRNESVPNTKSFSYEVLPSKKKIIASFDSSKLKYSEESMKKGNGRLYGTPLSPFHTNLPPQSNTGKLEKYHPLRIPKTSDASVYELSNPDMKQVSKESHRIDHSKPYWVNQTDIKGTMLSTSKTVSKRKTFEEWSNERRLGKPLSTVQDPQMQQPVPGNKQLTNQPKSKLELPVPTNTTSPGFSTKLKELEEDYFYGVRLDYDEIYSDSDEQFVVENTDAIVGNEQNIPPDAEDLEDIIPICTISEFLEKFAVDAINPLPHEINKLDAKRKLSSTNLPPTANSRSRRRRSKSSQSCHSKDYLGSSDEMVSLQVKDHNGEVKDSMLVLGMVIFKMKDSFPWFFKLIPAVDMEDISLPYDPHAIAIVLRCVLQASYTIPNWDVAVEVYALAKAYRVKKLVESCKNFFDNNPIAPNNVLRIAQLVKHFEVEEVFQNAKTLLEKPSFQNYDVYKIKSCTISSFKLKEPSEFSIPLFYSKGDLGSIKKSDFRNELQVESVRGVYDITGVQILFELESSDKGKAVVIFCEIVKGDGRLLDFEKEVKLQNKIELKFETRVCIRPKESINIIIMIEDLKSSWCYCSKDEKLKYDCKNGELSVKLKSHNKTSLKQSLFFIQKVYYTN